MFKGEELAVIQTIKPVYRGQEITDFPAHMNILPWFKTEYYNKELIHREFLRLGDYAIKKAIGVRRSLYVSDGPYVACDVEVDSDTPLRDMLLDFVNNLNVDFYDQSAVDDWVPHLGDAEDIALLPGDEVEFGSLALISRDLGKKVVEASYYISNHEQTTPR